MEKFILCRSKGRREKERAIFERQSNRLDEKLQKIKSAILAGRLMNDFDIAQRIGLWRGRYPKAERLIDVELIKDAGGKPKDLKIERRTDRVDWIQKANGCYLLRTNLTEEDSKILWKAYMQPA